MSAQMCSLTLLFAEVPSHVLHGRDHCPPGLDSGRLPHGIVNGLYWCGTFQESLDAVNDVTEELLCHYVR
jgi:hypothetical protein